LDIKRKGDGVKTIASCFKDTKSYLNKSIVVGSVAFS
jgi:hypothetical protein